MLLYHLWLLQQINIMDHKNKTFRHVHHVFGIQAKKLSLAFLIPLVLNANITRKKNAIFFAEGAQKGVNISSA